MTSHGSDRGGDATIDSDDALFQLNATRVISALFVLLKVALVHKMENRAVDPAVLRLATAIEDFRARCAPDVALQFVGDAVYVNRRLVRADVVTWEKASYLKDFFGKLKIAEIAFNGAVTHDDVRRFIQAARDVVHRVRDPDAPTASFAQTWGGIDVRNLDAAGAAASDEVLIVPDTVRVLRAYGIVVVTLRELLERLDKRQTVSLVPVRRAFQEFARLPEPTRALQLGLLGLEQYRGELAGRLANVAILVMLMLQRIDAGVADCRDAGVAAAASGIGRGLFPELLYAPPDECARRGAYAEGSRRLLRASGRGRAAAIRLIATTEQGAPESRRGGHPLSRLIAVAEQYDLLTQPRPHGPGMLPDVALRTILESKDTHRATARLLVCTLGLFPVGSTVKLTSGETAIVIDVPRDSARIAQPRVMVVADASGTAVNGRIIDLAAENLAVVGTVDAVKMDLNVGAFMFA